MGYFTISKLVYLSSSVDNKVEIWGRYCLNFCLVVVPYSTVMFPKFDEKM